MVKMEMDCAIVILIFVQLRVVYVILDTTVFTASLALIVKMEANVLMEEHPQEFVVVQILGLVMIAPNARLVIMVQIV